MNEPLRIARVLSRLNLGGPARQVLAADPLLVARGHAVRILTGTPRPGEGDLFEEARARGLDVVRVPDLRRAPALLGDLRARRFLRRALREFAPDVVHTHAAKAGALGRRAAAGLGAARVHTFHGHVLEGYFPAPLSSALVRLERRLARETERIVAVSHATAEDLLRLGIAREEQIVVVPPGIELERLLAIPLTAPARRHGALRAQLGCSEGTRLVGVVGRLAAVKRPEWALDVLALLAQRMPELQIVFVGDGELRALLERRIRALPDGLARRAHMIGAVMDMEPVLRDLDCVLGCSRSEGLPVALIEAAAAGLPAVATRVGGVGEIVAEERTGYLGENPDELAYGLATVFERPETAPAMGQRARLRAQARHGAEQLADNLERLYRAAREASRVRSVAR